MSKKLLTLIVTVLVILGSLYGAITGQTLEPAATEGPLLSTQAPAETQMPAETQAPEPGETQLPTETEESLLPDIDGQYDSKEEVALYIHTYGRLPDNYLTKAEARKLGWDGGSVERYAPGCCIGGDTFRNNEGQLPDAKGRKWTECDIDTLGKSSRGAKRIVFSNDGLIYYTGDHYETFELLYGEP